jgi:hypothetical protein
VADPEEEREEKTTTINYSFVTVTTGGAESFS